MRSFYRDVIGLRPRSDRPGFVNFDFDGVRLTISVHSDVVGPARDPLRLMLNFRTPDIHAAIDRIRGAGVRLLRPPEAEPWGGVIATFEDPDGNVLQYMQLPEYMPS